MKTIKSSKEIATLEVGDVIVFDNLEYVVAKNFKCISNSTQYYLYLPSGYNGIIFEILNFKKRDFVEKLGIDANCNVDFPETKSLEALTAIVSALFKEYEKQNELPKTWEEFCKRNHLKKEETFINTASAFITVNYIGRTYRLPGTDKNLCTSKQEAEAFLALMQLRQLRKAYVKDWEPNWICDELVHSVGYNYFSNEFVIESSIIWGNCMSFPTKKLATQFLANFKDLLEIAKPLL